LSSSPSADTEARLKTVLAAAGHSIARHSLTQVRPGLWRFNGRQADLAVKLYEGLNAVERLRTEAALYRELGRVGAPVPGLVATNQESIALARTWVPGATLYERLLADELLNQSAGAAVRDAWLHLANALIPWDARITPARRRAARRKRCMELDAVTQAVVESFPTLPADAIHTLSQTIAAGDLVVLPLDASPSNIILEGALVTFIDLELLGLDFAEWTYAKYVTAIDKAGAVRSLAVSHPDDPALPGLDAAVTLLALARAAGLWDAPRIETASLAGLIPGRSAATKRIIQSLGLESSVTSDSG